MYRCFATYSNNVLLGADRNIVGIPKSNTVLLVGGKPVEPFEYEKIVADKIRFSVSDFLSSHENYLNNLPEVLKNHLLEDRIDTYFDSFAQRIEMNRQPGTYPSHLEICALSVIFQVNIHIYQHLNGTFQVTAKYPSTQSGNEYHICLLYSGRNHYDLLLSDDCHPKDSALLITNGEDQLVTSSKWAIGQNNDCIQFSMLIELIEGNDIDPNHHVDPVSDIIVLENHLSDEAVHDHTDALEPPPSKKRKKSYKPSCERVRTEVFPPAVPKSGRSTAPNSVFKTYIRSQVTVDHFNISAVEEEKSKAFQFDVFQYVLERYTIVSEMTKSFLPGLKCKLALEQDPYCEKSDFKYFYVLDEKADCPATLEKIFAKLYDQFDIGKTLNQVVISGDALTFDYILRLKESSGGFYDWIVPYLADWHIIKNYQEVLMKLFWDAGLKDVPKNTPLHTTLRNLQLCGNFKKTHRFILQVYEALYMHQMQSFFHYAETNQMPQYSDGAFLKDIVAVVETLEFKEGCYTNIDNFIKKQNKMNARVKECASDFCKFCDDMSETYETFKFWNGFLTVVYIVLFIAMRSRDWDLRMHAVKLLTPLFHAADRHNYSKLLPKHISHMYGLPSYTLDHFKRGGFASNISGINFSSLGLDETHETTINKDCKMSLSRSLPQNMDTLAGTLEYSAKLISSYEAQLGATRKRYLQRDFAKSVVISELSNTRVYFNKFSATKVFQHAPPLELFQAFNNTPATTEQRKDLLSYRQQGQKCLEIYIKFAIFKDGSIPKLPIRRMNLHTFAKAKLGKRKFNYMEKEKKLIILCYKRAMLMSNTTNTPVRQLCQYLETPRAICTANGLPYHGTKATVYSYFEKRYDSSSCPVLSSYLFPRGNSCLIAEGMNIIYTKPLGFFRKFSEYAKLIIGCWITPYLTRLGYKDAFYLICLCKIDCHQSKLNRKGTTNK